MLNYIIFGQTAVLIAGGSFTGSGLVHMTGGVFDSPAYVGTADQLLATNHAGTDTAWFTSAGDVAYASGSFTVNGLKGSAIPALAAGVLRYNGASLEWDATGGAAPPGPDVQGTTSNWYVQSISGTSGAGGVVPILGTAYLRGPSGTSFLRYRNNANNADITALACDSGDNLTINASNALQLSSGSTSYFALLPNVLRPTTDLGSTIGDAAHRASSVYSYNFLSGGTGPSGGTATSIVITPDTANATNGTPGSVVGAIGAPTGTGTEAFAYKGTRGGAFFAGIGPHPSAPTQYGDLWLGYGITPSGTNYSIASDGAANTTVNGVSGVLFAISGVAEVQVAASAIFPSNDAVYSLGGSGNRWLQVLTQTGVSGSQYPGTGAHSGTTMTIVAEQGQQQTASNNNNNGGQLQLKSGAPGTGGSGTAGIAGDVLIYAGATQYMQIGPTAGGIEVLSQIYPFADNSYNLGAATLAFATIYGYQLVFPKGDSLTQISQNPPTSDVATNNLILRPQAPYASATGTHQNVANVLINSPVPVGTGTYGGLGVQSNGTTMVLAGDYAMAPTASAGTYGAIWFATASPTASNFTFLGSQGLTYLNTIASGATILSVAGSGGHGIEMSTNATDALAWFPIVDVITNLGGVANRWSIIYAKVGLNGGTHATSGAGSSMTIQAEAANTSGAGGTLILQGGASAGGASQGGLIQLNMVGGSPNGYVELTNGSTVVGGWDSAGTFWTFGGSGGTMGGSNTFAIKGDGTNLSLNSAGAGAINFGIAGTNYFSVATSGWGGVSGSNQPWAWQTTSNVSVGTGGTVTLTAAQYATPVIQVTASGVLTSTAIIVVPNVAGFWMFDITGLNSDVGTFGLQFKSGTATSSIITAASGLTDVVLVITRGSNTIAILQ